MAQDDSPSILPAPSSPPAPVPGPVGSPLTFPRLRVEEITLISGLRGRIRQMTAADQSRFVDPMLIRSRRSVDSVLQECWVETLDTGPYQFPDGRVDWMKVSRVDRGHYFIQLRQVSLGDEFDFNAQCSSPICGSAIAWQVKCSELPVRPMQPEAIQSIRSGEALVFTFPFDGRTCRHHIMRGSDEAFLASRGDQKGQVVDVLTVRIDDIDGVHSNDKRRWLERLSVLDQNAFLDEVERLEGGVDLAFPVECPKCGKEVFVSIMLDAPFFLGGSRQMKSAKTFGRG